MIDDDDDNDRILNNNRVEPVKSDHSKCEDLLVAYERWVPMTNEPQGFSSKNTSTPCKRIYCMQFPRYNKLCVGPCCYWMFFVYSEKRSAWIENREQTRHQEVKNNGKFLNLQL